MLTSFIIVVSALLIGYLWGKHDGLVYGNKQGAVSIPLLLRQESLEKGYCVLCSEQLTTNEIVLHMHINVEQSNRDNSLTDY